MRAHCSQNPVRGDTNGIQQRISSSSSHGAAPARRSVLLQLATAAAAAAAPPLLQLAGAPPASASGRDCPGMRGYNLQQCLRKARQERQAAEGVTEDEGVEAERMAYRQYEQPGELVTLPSGEHGLSGWVWRAV
jgi:hypothetical protein